MLKFKGITLNLLLFIFITLKLTSSLSLYRNKYLPLDVEVLNPSEFIIHLPEEEKRTLVNFRVNINEDISRSGVAHFEKDKADGHSLYFVHEKLNLKPGDIIYYSGLFEDEDGYHGENGSHIFKGVYTTSKRNKREVTGERSDDSSDDSSEEDSNSDSDQTYPIEDRSKHHHRRDYQRRRQRQRGHGRGHKYGHERIHGHDHHHGLGHVHGHDHGYGHYHGLLHLGPPRFHHGPGPWNGNGHGSKFGNNGPWNGCGEDSDEQFGTAVKPWINRGDHINGDHVSNNNKPGKNEDNRNTGSNNKELGNNSDNRTPNKGGNSGNNDSYSGDNNSNSENNSSKVAEDNDLGFEKITKRPISTEKSSPLPNIDIRFADVKDD